VEVVDLFEGFGSIINGVSDTFIFSAVGDIAIALDEFWMIPSTSRDLVGEFFSYE
jgi:hypothetical protein